MMFARARIKVYDRKQKKGEQVYHFKQAVAIIRARTINSTSNLEDLDGKEVIITDENTLILAKACEILVKFFIKLPEEVLQNFRIENEEEVEILKKAIKIVLGGGGE